MSIVFAKSHLEMNERFGIEFYGETEPKTSHLVETIHGQ